jgi:DNA polymerase-4
VVDSSVIAIVDRVSRRLRTGRRLCRTVVLRLRFDDFTRATRSLTLPRLTDQSQTILDAARTLLASARPLIERRGITLVGLSLTNLESADRVQLCLTDDWRPEALDAALDEVRDRYGSKSITRGVLVGRDPGIAMPLLPD